MGMSSYCSGKTRILCLTDKLAFIPKDILEMLANDGKRVSLSIQKNFCIVAERSPRGRSHYSKSNTFIFGKKSFAIY